jgi:hypothetical protein
MALYAGATWRGPVPNKGGAMGPIRWFVLHIQQGTEAGTDAWLHDPASRVSAHFGAAKDGGLDQWVDTSEKAWAEVNGNPNAISVECEGMSGQALTDAQVESVAELLAWVHSEYGVPLQVSDSPLTGVPGVTGHGLGAQAWGGHLDCPGRPILDQRPAIIARAAQIAGVPGTNPTTTEDDVTVFETGEIPQDTNPHMILVPPPNLAGGLWGDVRLSFGCDFVDGLTVRCAAWVDGAGWDIRTIPVPTAGDRVNPWNGPLPKGTQKVSVVRSTASGALGYLIEAVSR